VITWIFENSRDVLNPGATSTEHAPKKASRARAVQGTVVFSLLMDTVQNRRHCVA